MQWVVKSIKLHQDEQTLSFGKLVEPGEVGRLILMTGSHRNSSTLSSQKKKKEKKRKEKKNQTNYKPSFGSTGEEEK